MLRDQRGLRAQACLQVIELISRDQLLFNESLAEILDEIGQDEATAVARFVHMDYRTRVHVHEAGVTKESRQPTAHKEVDTIDLRIQPEDLYQTRPRLKRRVTDVRNPVSLVKRDRTTWSHELGSLGNDLFRARDIDENQTRSGKVETTPCQPC